MELERKFLHHDDGFLALLEASGFQHSQAKHEIDTYYKVNQVVNGNRVYLRIREDKGRRIFSLDYHIVRSSDATEEMEVAISDAVSMKIIMEENGHKPICIVDKKRDVYKKESISVVVDKVKDLGQFIEVEIMGDETEYNVKMLDAVCEQLKLLPESRIQNKGYPDLLLDSSRVLKQATISRNQFGSL